MIPEDTEYEMSICMFPSDSNPEGIVFGGTILSHIDKTSYVVAKKFTGSDSVLINLISNITIPTHVGNLLTIKGIVIHAGIHSMIIELTLHKENLQNRQKMEIGKSFAVLVHVDKSGTKLRLPRTLDLTDEQKIRGHTIKLLLEDLKTKYNFFN